MVKNTNHKKHKKVKPYAFQSISLKFPEGGVAKPLCSELIGILKDDENYREIGIRGDCVYAIFTSGYQKDLVEIFRHAYRINSFMKMFNLLLNKHNYENIHVGIGLGCDQELIIKAGKTGSGINDRIWIGKAVVDAAHLSDIANRNGISAIAMSTVFYDNIIELLKGEDPQYSTWILKHQTYYSTDFYHCNIIETCFDNWIDNEMG